VLTRTRSVGPRPAAPPARCWSTTPRHPASRHVRPRSAPRHHTQPRPGRTLVHDATHHLLRQHRRPTQPPSTPCVERTTLSWLHRYAGSLYSRDRTTHPGRRDPPRYWERQPDATAPGRAETRSRS
jgi:hypothetical protein